MSVRDEELIASGRAILAAEASAVSDLAARLNGDFAAACRLLAGVEGRVIVSGIGKSGHVARKISATFTSTGTPSTYLHPVEALHGDLGIVGPKDVAVLVSKSGRLDEVVGLIDYLARLGIPVVAIVGTPGSQLSEHADVVLDCSVGGEACPLDLTPTTSTTATMAMGDALAMVVLDMKGFRSEDFAKLHPGGALGRKLSVRVADVMVTKGYPWLTEEATMKETIAPLAEMRGTVAIVDSSHHLLGVVTAGDLTRLIERDPGFLSRCVSEVMTRDPKTAASHELGSAAAHTMEQHGIMALPVVDSDGSLIGVVHLHDLMRSGAV
ncbi:MAG TPA: KpsF/GutQ family sugar-phosphate isomerase [Longimicrobiales bacterium]|nr:KpsF/GutQ family sugar-phosphate isomerase [Longimicrobiales bacterium]